MGKGIGHISHQSYTKREIIKLIEEEFPDDYGQICEVTTIVEKDYSRPDGKTTYKQSVLFNGILGYYTK